jgi:murein endopeptidase
MAGTLALTAVLGGTTGALGGATPREATDLHFEPLPPPPPLVPDVSPRPPERPPEPDRPPASQDPPDPAPAADPTVRARWLKHRVVPGESLSQIALRYRTSVAELREWNDLGPDTIVKTRDRLRVWARKQPPPREKRVHVVGLGDTWGSVARAYGVSPSDLRAYNVRRTGRRLDEGERLDIWIDPLVYARIEGHVAEPGPAADIYPGGHSIGTPNDGRLVNAAAIPASPDYELRFPNSSWGTSHAVRQVVTAMHAFRTHSGFVGTISLGTMSRERGGEVGGHKSHQSGRDLDIRLPVKTGVPEGRRPRLRTIDWEATWRLVTAFVDTGEVGAIFLDADRQRWLRRAAERVGAPPEQIRHVLDDLVRHEPGHDIHLHVRFRCAAWEPECAD